MSATVLADDIDEHVPDPQVCKEFNITAMTIWRWDRNPELIALGWPPPMYIGVSIAAADDWKSSRRH